MEIAIDTVASGWPLLLDLFLHGDVARLATRHGVSFDIPGLTVWLANVNDLTVPEDYVYPELVKDYRDRLFGEQRERSLFYRRMTRWGPPGQDNGIIDQLANVKGLLASDSRSRSAVFSTWDPAVDLNAEFPISPVGGAFRVIEDEVLLLLTARSVDMWVGFVPEVLTFAMLTSDVALSLGLSKGRLAYHCWSAHIYEVDFVTYLPLDER